MRTGDQHHQRLEAEALPTTPSYKWISTLFAANSSRAQGTWVRGQEEQQAPCGPETPEAQPVPAGALAMPLAEVVVSRKYPVSKVARGSTSEKQTDYNATY